MNRNNLLVLITITVFVLVVSGLVAGTNVLSGFSGSGQNSLPQPTLQPLIFDSGPSNPSVAPVQWNTYTNTKYNYAIDYPEGWATIINISGENSKETLADAQSLDIFDSAAQKSYPDSVVTITWQKSASSLSEGWSQSKSTINGAEVQKFETEDGGLHKETYVIPSSDGVIVVEVRYTPQDAVKQIFEKMLSTLKST